jgi:hypothetical protein
MTALLPATAPAQTMRVQGTACRIGCQGAPKISHGNGGGIAPRITMPGLVLNAAAEPLPMVSVLVTL